MKNLYAKSVLGLLLIGGGFLSLNAQVQNVGIGTTQPDKSAVLDIQSVDKGLLIPRMSIDERNKINNPANGLLIFQTNEESGFYFYNKDSWKPLTANEVKAISADPNDWSLNGNTTTTTGVAAATASSFIGTPANIPINFKVGGVAVGRIDASTNLFMGKESGINNTGTYNIGVGTSTLKNNTTGVTNLAFGAEALLKNTTGGRNTGIGTFSLKENTTGQHNVGVGSFTLLNNISGIANLAFGSSALVANTIGNFNVGLGANSLNLSTSGSKNTGVGSRTLYNNLVGESNIAVGYEAGFSSRGNKNIFLGNQAGYNETGNDKLYIANSSTPTPLIYGDFSAKYVTIGDVTPALRSQGVATGGYNLLVKGGILTEKVKVALAAAGTDWADYVFEPTYKLMTLEEVESFTKENKHLPNVPSADEMVNSGLDVAQTSKMFMEKIEELTLYMIELNKEVKSLKAENAVLKAKLK